MGLGRIGIPHFAFALTALAGSDCPSYPAALQHRDRGVQSYVGGRLAEAAAALSEAVRLCPEDATLSFMLGNALYRSGALREAATAYGSAVALAPRHFEARMSLGFTTFELGAAERALEQWQAAAAQEPASPFARAALACALFKLGRSDEAVEQYGWAVFLDSRYATVAALTVDIRWKRDARATLEAVKTLRDRAMEVDPC